jgi:hypothetical protein
MSLHGIRRTCQWASGLGGTISKVNDQWIAESPMERVKIKFAERNEFGVLDHNVTLPSGAEFYNPMRVFANDRGSEVVFTLYRLPDMTDQTFAEDAAMIETDLRALKTLLEQ